ncbi:MAG TPA: hypothetical protein VN368_02215 [Candidatus Methylomirabilis sp.]|nr:hypothetical protein [Candidatus Methylomirabilis sp.]
MPQVLNGGCTVSKIYSTLRMESYEFWDTQRIKSQALCCKCDGTCPNCHKAVRLGSRKLSPRMAEEFESEIGDLDWRDNQHPEEQEADYRTRIGDYGHCCSEDEDDLNEPVITDLLIPGERLDFFELERRMLEQEEIHKEVARQREFRIRAEKQTLAGLISRKEMGEIISSEEEKVLMEGLLMVLNEASMALTFHRCGWFTALLYPELKGKDRRCNLCAKWRQAGDRIWQSRRTQNVSVMNANVLYRNSDRVVTDAKATLQFCRNQYRSELLDHLVKEFELQVQAGTMPWEVLPVPFMWEDHMETIRKQLVDLDSISWFGTTQDIQKLVNYILASTSHTQKKDALRELVSFLRQLRTIRRIKNPDIRADRKMVTAWLDSHLSEYGLPYSDNLWCPPNKSVSKPSIGPQPRYTTPAICMGCLVHRQGRC